jgi:peptidyl-prolyl cis-trans isomerase C
MVNGQPIAEVAVQRGLKRVPPDRHAEARPEIVNFLIDNLLIDQYLVQAQVPVDAKDGDAKVKQIKEEIQKEGSTFDKVMQELMLTEAELREQITAQLRWDKYAGDQATEPALRELFTGNPEMFDGTEVRARHILLTPPSGNAQAVAEAKARLAGFKKQIEDQAAEGLAKLPPQTDNLERAKTRARLVENAFMTLATKESACPSKAQGGDLGWFPRAGNMVEPFARAAFALKPYEMSDVVTTQFGQHLILVTDRRPGRATKFEEVKDVVKEVFAERLRDSLAARLRPTAQIVITPTGRP